MADSFKPDSFVEDSFVEDDQPKTRTPGERIAAGLLEKQGLGTPLSPGAKPEPPAALTGKYPSIEQIKAALSKRLPPIGSSELGVGGTAPIVMPGLGRASQGDIAGGASTVLRNTAEMATPALGPALVAAPVRTAATVGAGLLAQQGTERGLKALGVRPGRAEFAGDIAGAAAGYGASQAKSLNPADLFKVDPRVALTRGLRPTPSDQTFQRDIPTTLGKIKVANSGNVPKGITNGELDIIPATTKAIAEHQAALDQWITRAQTRGVEVPGDVIVKATRDAIPSIMWQENPEAANAIVAEAQRAYGGQTFSVDKFRGFLAEKNAGTASFYNKPLQGQREAVTSGGPSAIEKAQADAIRDTLYKYLDPEHGGAGPRQIQRDTGHLIAIREAAQRRNNAIVAEQPVTPFGKIVDPIKRFGRELLPVKMTGSGSAYAEGSEGRSLPLIRRAFKGAETPQPLPLPDPMYPTGNTTRMLPPPTLKMPPPADTSGPTGGQPYMGSGISPDIGTRRLEAGPEIRVTPPPADTSGPTGKAPYMGAGVSPDVGTRKLPEPSRVQSEGFAVQDMIPIRDPETGQIKYVAPWTQQPIPLGKRISQYGK